MKPILFNTDMVRAILAGKKTQTRIVCKVSSRTMNIENKDCKSVVYPSSNLWGICANFYDKEGFWLGAGKPKYQPGDILYVRETWSEIISHGEFEDRIDYVYKATDQYPFGKDGYIVKFRWHPSIHMPKEAARIFLLVKNIRVERLQNIQSMDAKAEGAEAEWHRDDCTNVIYTKTPIDTFAEIWNKAVKPGDLDRYGWYANPWVWVIEFERIEKEKTE